MYKESITILNFELFKIKIILFSFNLCLLFTKIQVYLYVCFLQQIIEDSKFHPVVI